MESELLQVCVCLIRTKLWSGRWERTFSCIAIKTAKLFHRGVRLEWGESSIFFIINADNMAEGSAGSLCEPELRTARNNQAQTAVQHPKLKLLSRKHTAATFPLKSLMSQMWNPLQSYHKSQYCPTSEKQGSSFVCQDSTHHLSHWGLVAQLARVKYT